MKTKKLNMVIAQSGGPSMVINESLVKGDKVQLIGIPMGEGELV